MANYLGCFIQWHSKFVAPPKGWMGCTKWNRLMEHLLSTAYEFCVRDGVVYAKGPESGGRPVKCGVHRYVWGDELSRR